MSRWARAVAALVAACLPAAGALPVDVPGGGEASVLVPVQVQEGLAVPAPLEGTASGAEEVAPAQAASPAPPSFLPGPLAAVAGLPGDAILRLPTEGGGPFLRGDDAVGLLEDAAAPPQAQELPSQAPPVDVAPPAAGPLPPAPLPEAQEEPQPAAPLGATLPSAGPAAAAPLVGPPVLPEVPSVGAAFLLALALPLLASFGWLLGRPQVLALVSHVDRRGALEHPNRQRLLELVEARPGARVQELMQASGLSRNTTAYHLAILERNGLVASFGFGRGRYVFPGRTSGWSLAHLSLLHDLRRRRIAAFVAEHPDCIQRQVSQALMVRPNRIHEQVRILAEAGLLECKEQGRTVRLNPTPELRSLLRSFEAPPFGAA